MAITGSSTPTILITGATGNIGRELTKRLSAQNIPFRAMVRPSKRPEQLSALPGAELVHGDLNEAKSIADALAGVERAFLLTNSSEQAEAQQVAFVDVAKRAGVKIPSFIHVSSGSVAPNARRGFKNALDTDQLRALSLVRATAPGAVITTEELGRAMIRPTREGAPQRVLENRDLIALGAMSKG